MLSLVFPQVGRMQLEECQIAGVGPNDVLIQVKAAGICGTDLHILHGHYPASFPLIPGHEYAGEVVEVGSQVKRVRIGDRVCIDPNVTCGICYYCRKGYTHLCTNLEAFGVTRSGGFAEYSVVPETHVYPLPDNISFQEGAMVEPIACCLRGIAQGDIKPGDVAVVLGAGSIGIIIVQLAKAAGASRVIVSEPVEKRRKLAAELGADVVLGTGYGELQEAILRENGVGADVVFECAGRLETAQVSLELVRRGGTVVLFGVCPPDKNISVNPFQVNDKEITIRGSFNNPFTHASAVDLLGSGRLSVLPLITHTFSLKDSISALETFGGPEVMKVMILPSP